MKDLCVGSYNVGANADDYLQLCKHLDPQLDPQLAFNTPKKEADFYKKYRNVQSESAALLIGKAQVYCLQEVANRLEPEERPLIELLKTKNFVIVHLEAEGRSDFDTAIALDADRFKDITNHSINVQINRSFKKDVAIATATDTESGQRTTFVSAHPPGFNFTKTVNKVKAAEGDFYCRAIVEKLSEIDDTMQIIGADMNANPEKWSPRFEIFSNQGFQVHRNNSATNVNCRDSVEQKREIDFIFTKTKRKTSICQKIKSIFVSTIQLVSKIKSEDSIGWDSDKNASDHLPVFIKISYEVVISKIQQLWNAICHFLSSCYHFLTSCCGSQKLQDA